MLKNNTKKPIIQHCTLYNCNVQCCTIYIVQGHIPTSVLVNRFDSCLYPESELLTVLIELLFL